MPNLATQVWQCLSSNYEAIVAISALFISVYSAYLSRKHNRLSVRPYITGIPHTSSSDKETKISFEIFNGGLGTAMIQSFKVLYNKAVVADGSYFHFEKFLNNLVSQENANNSIPFQYIESRILGRSYAMTAKERNIILAISFPAIDAGSIKHFQALFHRFDVIVEYKSLYGERLIFDTRQDNDEFHKLIAEA